MKKNSNEVNLTPVFFVPKVKTIRTANKPLSFKPNIVEKDVHEFAKEKNFRWTDGILGDAKKVTFLEKENKQTTKLATLELLKKSLGEIEEIPSDDISRINQCVTLQETIKLASQLGYDFTLEALFAYGKDIETQIEQCFDHTIEKDFVVCDLGITGSGVFYLPEKKIKTSIKNGSMICLYTGKYIAHEDITLRDEYTLEVTNHPVFEKKEKMQVNKGAVDATEYGNISRFFQDLPTVEELQNYYIIPKEILEKITTANIELEVQTYKSYPTAYFKALKELKPGDMIGFAYGRGSLDWWCHHDDKKRCFFDNTTGDIIDKKSYATKYFILTYEKNAQIGLPLDSIERTIYGQQPLFLETAHGKKFSFSLDELRPIIAEQLKDTKVPETLNEYETGYGLRFFYQIRYVLLQHYITACTEGLKDNLEVNKQKASYIAFLKKSIEPFNEDQAPEVYKKLLEIMQQKNSSVSSFYTVHLKELKSEIIAAMNSYNAAVKSFKNQKNNSEEKKFKSIL